MGHAKNSRVVDVRARVIDLARQSVRDGTWFDRALAAAEQPLGIAFRAALASTPRRLGPAAETRALPDTDSASSLPGHWTLVDVVRLALLLRALERTPQGEHASTVLRLFESGEIGEQVSLLRTLPLLPEPARFVHTGLEACRTNAKAVFEAIVCENPYPAAHFPERGFNQAVLKAMFIDVSVRRIEGLSSRITPELRRMVVDFASERRAAGRHVSEDTAYLIEHR
jgi:hypothetical protein